MTYIPTRGERNSNPCNIDYSAANAWQGQIGIELSVDGETPRFGRFANATFGIRAACKLLERYILQGYATAEKIANRWAPDNENNSATYAEAISQYTKTDPAHEFSSADLANLVSAIIIIENGRNIYAPQIISDAVAMALS